MKKNYQPFLAVLCLLILLSQPALAFSGAKSGLILWATVVLPTLFPFMICTGVVVAVNGIPLLTRPFSPILKGIFHLSQNGSFVMLTGLLCGYPLGAKTDSDFLESGRLSQKQAQYLLAIANHPSPMFLLGYCTQQIHQTQGLASCPSFFLPLALYLPVLPLSWLAGKAYHYQGESLSQKGPSNQGNNSPPPFSFDLHMMSCYETMVKIGCYMMLFSILIRCLEAFPWQNQLLCCILVSAAEITTGTNAVSKTLSGLPALLMIGASVAFGGISGIFQTKSVLKSAGLSIRHYILWKSIHGIFTCLVLWILWIWFPH